VKATISIIGGDSHEFDISTETYADLLKIMGISPNEVVIIVDDVPVPHDSPVTSAHSKLLTVLSGG
tara:strand:+ start:24565 stop:24762 length:198 start_codon:yes stop_codon:yes gene_type:complete